MMALKIKFSNRFTKKINAVIIGIKILQKSAILSNALKSSFIIIRYII